VKKDQFETNPFWMDFISADMGTQDGRHGDQETLREDERYGHQYGYSDPLTRPDNHLLF